jgi:hypothetical protein
MAVQDANAVNITGGSLANITDLTVADGGTGASNPADARTNLGLQIGVNVQASNALLDQLVSLVLAAPLGSLFYVWQNVLGQRQMVKLSPSIYGQVLVTQGANQPPFWDWVWQSPGAAYSGHKVINAEVRSSALVAKLTINQSLLKIADGLDSDCGMPLYHQEVAPADGLAILISMSLVDFSGIMGGGSGNNFAPDSHYRCLWNLDDGALTDDSSGNGNTLTNYGVSQLTGGMKAGTGCGGWAWSQGNYMTIADSALAANFPTKSGSPGTISVCFWFYIDDWTDSASFSYLVNKWNSWWFGISHSGRTFVWFKNDWTSYSPNLLNTGRWHHLGFAYDSATYGYRLVLWDDTAQQKIIDETGTLASGLSVLTDNVYLGDPNGTHTHNGRLDEIVFFDDVLTADEIDQIREGTFGSSGGAGSQHLWSGTKDITASYTTDVH